MSEGSLSHVEVQNKDSFTSQSLCFYGKETGKSHITHLLKLEASWGSCCYRRPPSELWGACLVFNLWSGWHRTAAASNSHLEGIQGATSWQDAEMPMKRWHCSMSEEHGCFIFFWMFPKWSGPRRCVKQVVPNSQGWREAGSFVLRSLKCLHIIPEVGGYVHWLSGLNRNK